MTSLARLQPLTVMRYLIALVGLVLIALVQPVKAAGPAPEQSTREFEIRFMEEMIHHHMMAVHMSEACLTKAVHPELQAMCQEMITSQQQEIMTMQQWLAAWYGVSLEHRHNPGHQNRMEKLAALSGAEFEVEFMQQMVRHHRTAVVKASQCIARAYHEELQDLCTEMVEAQSGEILKMQEWLCSWYGLCRPRRTQ